MNQLWEKYSLTEYAGLLLYKPETNDFIYAKYRHLNKYRVEDPRLYMKSDNNIYMSYVGYIPEIEKTGQWEIRITYDLNNIFFSDPNLICYTVNNQKENNGITDIFSILKLPIFKNYSHIEHYDTYLDGFNGSLVIITPTGKSCNRDDIIMKDKFGNVRPDNLKHFIQDSWKISLTSPTIKVENYYIGVAHVRIGWNLLSENYDKICNGLKSMIKKCDVHHNDCYFMSIYKIKDEIWELTPPFLISGDYSDNYYTYNINFPTGITYENGKLCIQYGLGDAILCESCIDIPTFYTNKFDYGDIEFIGIKDPILDKSLIKKSIIESQNISLLKYILPKHIYLFDFGCHGLRMCEYRFSTFSDIKFIGKWKEIDKQDLWKKIGNKNDIINSGAQFMFSLSDYESSINELFDIPKHNKVYQINASVAHLYGNLRYIREDKHIEPHFLLSISISSSICLSLYNVRRKLFTHKEPYNINYNGKSYRDAFMNAFNNFDSNEIIEILNTLYEYQKIPDKTYTVFSCEELDITNLSMIFQNTNIYFNNDKKNVYYGLVYNLSMNL
jgi:hypothetical protein